MHKLSNQILDLRELEKLATNLCKDISVGDIYLFQGELGAGKTTLCKLLIKKMKNINLSISYTSRSKRLNEVNGKDYYFVSKKKFENLKKIISPYKKTKRTSRCKSIFNDSNKKKW